MKAIHWIKTVMPNKHIDILYIFKGNVRKDNTLSTYLQIQLIISECIYELS